MSSPNVPNPLSGRVAVAGLSVPPIIPIVATGAFMYGAYAIAPNIAVAIVVLLVMYVGLTHIDRATALIGKVDTGAAKLIAPTAGGGRPPTLR